MAEGAGWRGCAGACFTCTRMEPDARGHSGARGRPQLHHHRKRSQVFVGDGSGVGAEVVGASVGVAG